NVAPLSPVVALPQPAPRPTRSIVPPPMTTGTQTLVDAANPLSRRDMGRPGERPGEDQRDKHGKGKGKKGAAPQQDTRPGGRDSFRGKGKRPDKRGPQKAPTPIAAPMSQAKKVVKITDTIVVAELAKAMGVKATDVMKKLIAQGMMVTLNQSLDYETS